MEKEDLKTKLVDQLRTLRTADSQAKAVAWMKEAYLLMEQCLKELDRPEPVHHSGLVYVPDKKVICLPDSVLSPIYSKPPVWLHGQTIVYPEKPLPPPKPRPWTHIDTLRLERATKERKTYIQRKGK